MKLLKKWFNLAAAFFCAACCLSLLSCESEGSTDEPSVLKVNPTSISMLSAMNSSVTVTITCTDSWSITDYPAWVNLSSTSGNGNTSVVITAISANETSKQRTGVLTITSGDLRATVELTQLAGLQSGCEVSVIDEVIMYNSVTFKLKFGPKASYFHAAYFPATSAGWPDSRVIAALEEGEAINAEDGMLLNSDESLTRNTAYIQCFVAYDSNGNRGDVVRRSFSTPNATDKSPKVYINNMGYNSSKWQWETSKNATTTDYFMLAVSSGYIALDYFYAPTSWVGMIIKETADYDNSYINDGKWYMSRTSNDMYVYVATWARRDQKWSDVITDNILGVTSAAPASETQRLEGQAKKSGKMSAFYNRDREELMKFARIIKF